MLWKRKFCTVSLATAMSTRPSPSTSNGATPSALASGAFRSGVRTWMPDSSLTSVNRPPSLRSRQQSDAGERGRRAVGPPQARELEALDLVDLGGPGDVVADEQVEVAVVVDVEERRAGEPAVGALGVGGLGDVLEVALAVVAEQMAAADGRDVEVGVAVVVVIADGDALAVEGLVEAGLLRHVLEVPLAVVAVEGLGRRGVLVSCPGQGHELTKSRSWSPSLS